MGRSYLFLVTCQLPFIRSGQLEHWPGEMRIWECQALNLLILLRHLSVPDQIQTARSTVDLQMSQTSDDSFLREMTP